QRTDDGRGVGTADDRVRLSRRRRRRRGRRGARVRDQPRAAADAVRHRAAARRIGADAVRRRRPRPRAQPRRRALHRKERQPAADAAEPGAADAAPRRPRRHRTVLRQRRHRSRAVAAQRRHPTQRRVRAGVAGLPPQRGHHRRGDCLLRADGDSALAAARRRPRPPAVRRRSHRGGRPVAAHAAGDADARDGAAAGRVRDHGGEPARNAIGARPADRSGAPDSRSAAVAAAAGGAPGSPRRGGGASVRRRPRAEQPAAGDSRHRRAPRARARFVAGGARRNRLREDAERPRARDHPQPLALQQPAVGAARARGPARSRRGKRTPAPRPPAAQQHRARSGHAARPRRARQLHRDPAGDAEFHHQRAAGHRSDRPSARPRRHPPDGGGQESAARSPGRRPGRAGAGRAEVVPAVLHDEAGRAGDRARTVGQLRNHRVVLRHDRLRRQRVGRRDVLLRAARRRTGMTAGRPKRIGADAIVTCLVIAATALHVRVLTPDISWRNDDTLHYLNHARNIAAGRPYGDTGYVYSRYSPDIGPANYPPAFPLTLAPIYRYAGLESFTAYKVSGLAWMALILALTALWCWRLPPLTRAAGVVAVLACNPVVIRSSVTVVSDPMFTAVVLAALFWIDGCQLRGREGIGSSVVTGLLAGIAVETRSMGVAILAALVLRSAVRRFEGWQSAAIAIAVSTALAVATNRVVHADATLSDYTSQFLEYSWRTPLRNVRIYAGDFATEVLWPVPGTSGFAKIALLLFLVVVAAGLRRTIRERRGLTIFEYFAGPYLAMVLVWPAAQGSRFLLPLLPWAVRLAFVGLDEIA